QAISIQLPRQRNNNGQFQRPPRPRNNNSQPRRLQTTPYTRNIFIDTQQHAALIEGAPFDIMQNARISSRRIKFSRALFSGFPFT
ncbi:26013_t:CDS:1, partial [Racocetra persica]